MSPAESERVVGDRYRLTQLIAVGGMGEVWRGTDLRLAREVAVKILKPEYGREPTFLARFRAEARHAAGLTHPGIAAVYDYGEVQEHGQVLAYLVMELVDGEPLSHLLAAHRALPPGLALSIVGQTALALQAAHDAGVIHRDIKPGNLLILRDNRDDPSAVTVKVTDFGIARAVDAAPLTRTGMVMGTAHYLSPEQARAGAITPSSDIYSLGVVAYECLSGRRPFTGDTAFAIAAAHAHDAPPALPDDLPAPIRVLVGQAMAKDPRDRPASAGAFGRAALQLAATYADAPASTQEVLPDESATQLLTSAVPAAAAPTRMFAAVGPDPYDQPVGPAPRTRRPLWPWLVALFVAVVAGLVAFALSTDQGGPTTPKTPTTPSHHATTTPHRTTTAATHTSVRATTTRPATTTPAATTTTAPTTPATTTPATPASSATPPSSATASTPAPQPSVTVDPAAYVGHPYNEVASDLQQLGLTPDPTSVDSGGPPGTVTGVEPAGPVKAGSTVVVSVVTAPPPPDHGGPGAHKTHKPPHG